MSKVKFTSRQQVQMRVVLVLNDLSVLLTVLAHAHLIPLHHPRIFLRLLHIAQHHPPMLPPHHSILPPPPHTHTVQLPPPIHQPHRLTLQLPSQTETTPHRRHRICEGQRRAKEKEVILISYNMALRLLVIKPPSAFGYI